MVAVDTRVMRRTDKQSPRRANRGHADAAGRQTPARRVDTIAVVVDGNTALADLAANALARRFGLAVTAMTTAEADVATQLAACSPILIILDAAGSDDGGLRMLPLIRRTTPAARVLVLVPDAVVAAVRNDSRFDPRQHVLAETSAGWPAISRHVATMLTELGHPPTALAAVELLSPRELEVFALIGRGCSTAAIAEFLGIGQQTVETHRKGITRKLRAKGAELVRLAVLHAIDHRPLRTPPARASHHSPSGVP